MGYELRGTRFKSGSLQGRVSSDERDQLPRAREVLECITHYNGGAIRTELEVFCPLGLVKVFAVELDTHTHTKKARAENIEMIGL